MNKRAEPLDAYEAHERAREAHEKNEVRERLADDAVLADVYTLVREAADKGDMFVIWPTPRSANHERRVEYVKKALKASGYRLVTATGGWRITWTEAPPEHEGALEAEANQ